ncbi:nucleotidyl transferase AbiEii/AbiGii toxin family protein, partial [Bradyrhizobium sp.]|uniref:nucleotidyl transferase AbiEii/AbiGii toxin family protein n=1 Tax=Bradyrhizobium sp. TaxID=376 RepID=UPI003C796911
LGGGTAMMLQIDHRESHDLDIFLPDAQLLPFLDPQKRDFDFGVLASEDKGDGTKFLKLAFEIGEIDFIVGNALTSSPTTQMTVEGETVLLEKIPEIIAKKIYHRGSNIMPRDIFDIAAGSGEYAEAIIRELRAYRDAVAKTLTAMDRQNPDFVSAAIAQLSIKDAYSAVARTAFEKTKELLRAV